MKRISRRLRPATVTLYNHISTTAGVATYQRTVLKHVSLNTGYQQTLSKRGVSTTDKAQLILELRDLDAGGRIYSPLPVWIAALDKTGLFTFAADKDFFVEGEVSDELPPMSKQQMQGKFQVFSITACNTPSTDGSAPVLLVVTGK